jgi:hypothetical protein
MTSIRCNHFLYQHLLNQTVGVFILSNAKVAFTFVARIVDVLYVLNFQYFFQDGALHPEN